MGIDIIDEKLEREIEQEVESICKWAAARAGVIVVAPLLGTMALIANEVYMIMRIGKAHGETLSESMVVGFLSSLGAAFVGQTLATLIPFAPVQIPIAVSVTYALGKVAHAWLKAGKPNDLDFLKKVFEQEQSKAKKNITLLLDNPKKDEPLGDERKDYNSEIKL